MTTNGLTSDQIHALLDILSHHEVYAEIRDFRFTSALSTYGPPFQTEPDTPSTSPSLQSLISKFALPLPGLRDVSQDFWQGQCAAIIADLDKADLSESYDKGTIGIRKTLATALSALIEYPVRGVFAGLEEPNLDAKDRHYNTSIPSDLSRAFRDIMHQAVYGDLIDDMFAKTAETDKLSDHSSLVQAAHEYGVVNIASFMHYTLILSPKGQFLLMLIDQANKLVPYAIIKQTLKIGNVATMINAMMKVVLAKMSVASVTNWIGLTNGTNEGMNLMQHIISTVLHWDTKEFRSRAAKIEKDKEAPTQEQLHALKSYLHKTPQEHDSIRQRSEKESKSIVLIILQSASVSTALTDAQHEQALEYLAMQLSIRDREKIVEVLCHSQPDHLTQAVRELVAAYEPIIRQLHNAVDLSESMADLERFLKDMIKLSRVPNHSHHSTKETQLNAPTVGDFVQLLKKHQASSHRFMHQCAKNGVELTGWFHEYALQAARHFQQSNPSSASPQAAGNLTGPLTELFASLSQQERESLVPILDAHALYLSKLHAASAARLRGVVTSEPSSNPVLTGRGSASSSRAGSRASSPAPSLSSSIGGLMRHHTFGGKHGKNMDVAPAGAARSGNAAGPGAFLARWQALLDSTVITPAKAEGGEVRTGAKASVLKASREEADPDVGLSTQGSKESASSMDSHGSGRFRPSRKHHGQNSDDGSGDEVFEDAHDRIDALRLEENEKLTMPDTRPVVQALLPAFREMLGRRACTW